MAKTVLDPDLRAWEAFATTGPYGYSDQSRVVFYCRSDDSQRPRSVSLAGDKSDAETTVATASRDQLLDLLARARPID